MSHSERHVLFDGANLTIGFSVRWFGVLPVRGTFGRVHGGIELHDEGICCSIVRVDVEASSVRTGIGLRDRHLRGPRFLFADLHPFLSFRSTLVEREVDRLVVQGVLSARGYETPMRVEFPLGDVSLDRATKLATSFVVSRRACDVGVPKGIAALNPMFAAIADDVRIDVRFTLPAGVLRPTAATASR